MIDTSKLMAPSVRPLNTRGSTGIERGQGTTGIYEEFLPNMRSLKQRTDLYHQIASNSPIVGASLHLIRSYLARAPLTWVSPDTEAVDFMNTAAPPATMRALVDDAATMLTYGFSLVEIALKLVDGRYVIRRLAPRSPRSVQDWIWDEAADEAVAFTQYATGRRAIVPLNRCMHFRIGRGDADNPEGAALLRHAYQSDYYSRRLQELEAIGVERDLAGLPYLRVPGEMLDPNATTEQKAALATFQNLLTDIRRDRVEGIILPSDADDKGNPYFEAKLLSVGGNRQVHVGQSIERYDKRIGQAFLTGFLFLGLSGGGTGSYALSDSSTEIFKASLKTLLDSIADQINERLVPMIWRANGFPGETMPQAKFGAVDRIDLGVLADTVSKLVTSGFSLDDAATQDSLRESAGLPPTPKTPEQAERPIHADPEPAPEPPAAEPAPATDGETAKALEERLTQEFIAAVAAGEIDPLA